MSKLLWRISLFCFALGISSSPLLGQAQPNLRNNSFYNWESPHVHPLDITPDSTKLLAVNTANNSLEVYNVSSANSAPIFMKSIPVGLDPVSVRVRTNSEAWVVNVISDSVSIVNLNTMVVTNTIRVDDEPADVVFAGTGTKQAYISCAQAKTLLVVNPATPNTVVSRIPIMGEQPRALATSIDGRYVYLAIFESGNGTTAVTGGKNDSPIENDLVRDTRGPYGGVNVPPNSGQNIVPAFNTALPAPPPVSMIVKRTVVGSAVKWLDDNMGDWSAFISGQYANNGTQAARPVGWDLPDRDVAIVDTSNANALSYQGNLLNIVMAIAVNPATGETTVVGTDATNQIRYEPNLQATFLRVNMGRFVVGGSNTITDLNPHLTYKVRSIPVAQRQLSIGDPRGIVWNAAGTAAYVTGMGSNNVVVINKAGARTGLINIGQGPTGIVLQEANSRGFVLNKFDASISTINLSSLTETSRTPLSIDPTPAVIKAGRPILYNTQQTSGLGQIACASCHVDGRWDRLAWDLGNPAGSLVTNSQGISFHPMKGPLLTMTLVDTMQAPFLHWRGDRPVLEDFEGAFQTLQGADQPATETQIDAMRRFLSVITLVPNPNRNLDNSYSTTVPLPGPNNTIIATGDANQGAAEFEAGCRSCHFGQTGRGKVFVLRDEFGQGQYRNPPTWKNFYKRLGLWFGDAQASTTGFGFQQDGTFDSTQNHTRDNNLMAFMLSFNGGFPYEPASLDSTNVSNFTHAAVGNQITISPTNPTDTTSLLVHLQALADQGAIGLVAKGMVNGVSRGYAYLGNQIFQSDTITEQDTMAQLLTAAAGANSTLTFTAVPTESLIRIGIDQDSDGIFDADDVHPTVPDLVQTNLALQGTATMSSVYPGNVGPTGAIDGNTLGYYDQNSVAHSAGTENNPWWQVDLGNIYDLSLVQLFNRTDCCSTRLTNVSVFVSMTPFTSTDVTATRNQAGVKEFLLPGYAGLLPQIPMYQLGRYVRVQLSGASTVGQYLQLAEVRVFGSPYAALGNPGNQSSAVSAQISLPMTYINSTGSPFTFSAANLPPGLTINSTTGLITGTIASGSATSYAVTVTATSTLNTYTVSFNWAITTGISTSISLAGQYNLDAIGTTGTAPIAGGLDGYSYVYASNLLGASATYNGANFTFGPPNTYSGICCATVPVTQKSYGALYLLGTAVDGNQTNQAVTVTYTDGTTSTFQQSFSDWAASQKYSGESVVVAMPYRLGPSGATNALPVNLYGYTFALNKTKTVKSVTLPNNAYVRFLAVTLK